MTRLVRAPHYRRGLRCGCFRLRIGQRHGARFVCPQTRSTDRRHQLRHGGNFGM